MDKIAKALVRAQQDFGPALKKNVNGAFKGSKYADLQSCVDAVIDAFNDAGIFLMQQTHECNDGVIVETVFVHESGETLSSGKLHVPAAKHDPHGFGSALTYARRYSLMAACGIAPEDDDGNSATESYKKVMQSDKITAEQLAEIRRMADETSTNVPAFCQWLQVSSLADITQEMYPTAYAGLEAKKRKAA